MLVMVMILLIIVMMLMIMIVMIIMMVLISDSMYSSHMLSIIVLQGNNTYGLRDSIAD